MYHILAYIAAGLTAIFATYQFIQDKKRLKIVAKQKLADIDKKYDLQLEAISKYRKHVLAYIELSKKDNNE